MRLYPIYIWKKDKNIDTFQALLPDFQTIVQRKYVRILAITFAVGIEPRTLGAIPLWFERLVGNVSRFVS